MIIEAVTPELDGGRSAVKRIAEEPLHVEADIFKEGHDVLAAVVWWRQLSPEEVEALHRPTEKVERPIRGAKREFRKRPASPPRLRK